MYFATMEKSVAMWYYRRAKADRIQSLERDYNHYYFIMRGMVYYDEYD